jgi:hypothetical protein
VTPVPLDLPLRPPEAAELANLIFSQAERKPLNDEVRGRIASRLAATRFESLRPYARSLERDPVHHSTYYMAVDGRDGEPLLLHMAPAAAPTSAIFAKALLIGRMRQTAGPEMVINAIPFGPADRDSLDLFSGHIDDAFLPRPQVSRAALVAHVTPAVFEGFGAILKRSGKNVASIAAAPGESPAAFYYAGLWAAVRAGWRDGYSAGIRIGVDSADMQTVCATLQEAAPLTRFSIDVSALAGATYEAALSVAERVHELIRQARAARKITRPFDFELSLERAARPTTPEDVALCLEWLKNRAHAAQLIAPRVGSVAELPALADAARAAQCILSVDAPAGDLTSIGRATAGRVNYRLSGAEELTEVAAELFG